MGAVTAPVVQRSGCPAFNRRMMGSIPTGSMKLSACGVAWHRACLGRTRSLVRIQPLRSIDSCEAHADEHRPDKSEVAGANPAAATSHAGAHGARHRCQRGTGRFDSVRPLQFAPADGPVDGLLSRRCWFESNSGRHTRADGNGGDLLNLHLSVRV